MTLLSIFRSRKTSIAHSETAFPFKPLLILALCRICEPIAFTSIFPYIYYMVQSFNITDDEKQISIYAGMVTSAFAIAEFSASIFWGWLSDRVGRKPVLLTGLAGTGLSMMIFGFAKSLPVALLARTLGGLLNGNIGVILTTVNEVVTVDAHQSRAFAIMPFVWCIGSIIGAALGGSLANPVAIYPNVFANTGILARYPYLLPNLICTGIIVVSLVVGFLFLEETHQDKRSRKDVGLELGRWLTRTLVRREQQTQADDGSSNDDVFAAADEKGNYHPIPSSPQMSASVSKDLIASGRTQTIQPIPESAPKSSFWLSLTRQIRLIIVSYGLLAFHTISLEQLLPIVFASDAPSAPPMLPFKFDGGFALSAKTIGFILSFQGVLQMIVQIVVFPLVSERFGSLTTFRIAVLSYPFLYLLIPYMALVPSSLRYPCIVLILAWKVTAQSFSFPSQSIMLAKAAPSKRVLGTLNGVAMSAASLARAFGPTLIGIVHALGRQQGYSIFSWWTCALVATVGALVSLCMEESARAASKAVAAQEPEDEEKAEAQPLLARLSAESETSTCASSVVDEPLD